MDFNLFQLYHVISSLGRDFIILCALNRLLFDVLKLW